MPKISRINPVLETVKNSPSRISKLMVQRDPANKKIREILTLARARQVPIVYAPAKHLNRLDRRHQGLVAFVAQKEYVSLDEIQDLSGNPFFVLLDGIEDPQNLGALIRTAEGAGVDAIVLPERRSARLTDAVFSVSAGALEHINIVRVKNLSRTMEELKKQEIWLVGAEGGSGKMWHEFDYRVPVGLVLGSEGKGLHELIKKKCDVILSIPHFGKMNSLNVAAAGAVFMYEVVRQRGRISPARNKP